MREAIMSLNPNEVIQLVIAIATAFAAVSAAISIKKNDKDRKLSYKPQFEIITDEGNNDILHVANLNPNYQSYEVIKVNNKNTGRELEFEKQLTNLNGGLNFLKINFPKDVRQPNVENFIVIEYKSVIGVKYIESVKLPIDEERKINCKIRGLIFK